MNQTHKLYFYALISLAITIILFIFSLALPHQQSTQYLLLPFFLAILLAINIIILFLSKHPDHVSAHVPESTPKKQESEQAVAPEPPITPQQQEELKEETILANIGEGLVIIDKLGQIVTFNKAAQSLLGWTEEEALGKNFADIVRIGFESIDVKNQTLGHQSSLHFIRKDGTQFPASITTSSYVQGDQILGTITLFRDVTAERNIDKMKNEFISLASHQLRTPLAAIKWYSKMLLNGDAGKLLPEQSEYTESIYTSTNRMIDLVNALLNISRIESGRIIVEPQPTDISKMATEVVEEVKIRYVDRKQKIELKVHDTIPMIPIDPKLVRQVYVNLLTNAAKYTPEKGEIMVTISKTDKDVISEIKDNGHGIPLAEQDKVFGKFYRGANMVGGGSDGTGLGLYLVKSIIELSMGKIWFKSEEGKGTTFWFSLPLTGTPAKKGVLSLET